MLKTLRKLHRFIMRFRTRPAVLKQKTYHNSPKMQPIVSYFQSLLKFGYVFKTIERVLSLL